jgi:monoamine oxidase
MFARLGEVNMKVRELELAVSRRAMLAGMAGVAGMAVAGGYPASASNYDVVVIGAGSAGIAAAQALRALGRTCLVVEAANRIGGRALTDTTTFPLPFDIGCAWIHASRTNPYYPLAIERGYHLRKHDVDTLNELFYSGAWQGAPGLENEHRAETLIEATVNTTAAEGHDIAMGEVLANCDKPMDAAATFIGPMDAAVDLKDESSFDYKAESDAEYDPNFLVREGFGALVADLGKGINASLSTPVRAIRYDRKGVSVETAKGTVQAKAVIVTVSTGVLQKGAIKFTPSLPVATQKAIADLPMGLLTKIPLLVPGVDHHSHHINPYDNFLVETPPKTLTPPCVEAPGDFYFLAWPWDSDLQVGFVGGSYAWELSKRPDAEVIALATDKLAEVYGSAIRGKVKEALVTPWANNPLTHGAYSAAKPGHGAARDALRVTVANRVFFAGEAAAEGGLFATCGGAYRSGAAVAQEVHGTIA